MKNSVPLSAAIVKLAENDLLFQAGGIKSVQHSDIREAALVEAIDAIATEHGVSLIKPLRIDARGEFTLNSVDPRKGYTLLNQAPYGAAFAALLTSHNARTGVSPGAHLMPLSNWCSMHHFDVERLVKAYAHAVMGDAMQAKDDVVPDVLDTQPVPRP